MGVSGGMGSGSLQRTGRGSDRWKSLADFERLRRTGAVRWSRSRSVVRVAVRNAFVRFWVSDVRLQQSERFSRPHRIVLPQCAFVDFCRPVHHRFACPVRGEFAAFGSTELVENCPE